MCTRNQRTSKYSGTTVLHVSQKIIMPPRAESDVQLPPDQGQCNHGFISDEAIATCMYMCTCTGVCRFLCISHEHNTCISHEHNTCISHVHNFMSANKLTIIDRYFAKS